MLSGSSSDSHGRSRPSSPARRTRLAPPQVQGVQLVKRLSGGRPVRKGVVARAVGALLGLRPAEVLVVEPHHETAHHNMREPPGDCRHRRRVQVLPGQVDEVVTRAKPGWRVALPARACASAAWNWLPEVLLVGEPIQPGPKLAPPMPVQLIMVLPVPGDRHGGEDRLLSLVTALQVGWDRSR